MKKILDLVRSMDRRLAIILAYAALAMTPFAYQISRKFFFERWGDAVNQTNKLWYAVDLASAGRMCRRQRSRWRDSPRAVLPLHGLDVKTAADQAR